MKKENILNLFLMVIVGVLVVVSTVQAATTISTNIATDGTLTVSGTASSTFAGAVGIATTSPSHLLSIQGSASDIVYINTSATGPALYIDSFGQMGVGTSSISGFTNAKLTVHQTFSSNYAASFYNVNSPFHNASRGVYIQTSDVSTSPALKINSNGGANEIFVVQNNGNVGIGVTGPATQLQVAALASNATSSVTIGKASQNKGACLVMYDVTGAVKYVSIVGTSFVISATSCQ